jgi:CSLREA domain-containing protein
MWVRNTVLRYVCVAMLIAILLGALSTLPARAAGLVVSSSADDTTGGNGLCTLREAINNANANSDTTSGDCAAGSGTDTITFDASLSGAAIMLGSDLPALSDSVTIHGFSLGSQLTIDGADTFRPFYVNPGVTLALTTLTISNGGGTSGGGIYNNGGTVTLAATILSSSTVADSGGAIYNAGALSVSTGTFSDNSASTGGGIYNSAAATLTVNESSFSDNTASASGGGIYNTGTLAVNSSTFSANNAAGNGAGIQNGGSGTLSVANSTIAGNTTSASGGGISNGDSAVLTVSNSTISGNSANASGGGIFNNATFNYANTIIANSAGGDCANGLSGTIGTNTDNLVEDNSCSASLSGDPELGQLAFYGGKTATMPILWGSPAIDTGNNTVCADPPVNNIDQREEPRPFDGNRDGTATCDIGSFETKEPTITTMTADAPDPSIPNDWVTVTVSVGGLSVPTGEVKITGADTNCAITLTDGTGSCQVQFTSAGNKVLTASYTGDATRAKSWDTDTHTVWYVMRFVSQSVYDGWLLESSEGSNRGGTKNASASILRVGDDSQDRQYKSILSLNTSSLPDRAIITRVVIYVKKSSVTGSDPVNTHGRFFVDIRKPYFGSGRSLVVGDFSTSANLLKACTIGTVPTPDGWYSGTFLSSAFRYVNKAGTTQLRLRFSRDDNDDRGADVLNLFSGSATIITDRPYVEVYYLP